MACGLSIFMFETFFMQLCVCCVRLCVVAGMLSAFEAAKSPFLGGPPGRFWARTPFLPIFASGVPFLAKWQILDPLFREICLFGGLEADFCQKWGSPAKSHSQATPEAEFSTKMPILDTFSGNFYGWVLSTPSSRGTVLQLHYRRLRRECDGRCVHGQR